MRVILSRDKAVQMRGRFAGGSLGGHRDLWCRAGLHCAEAGIRRDVAQNDVFRGTGSE
jgi:hypothetical protein